MIKKIIKTIILGAFIYFLFLLSLPPFSFFPFLLVLIFLINLSESPKESLGLLSAFFVGLFWDIYSSHFIGMMAIALPAMCILLKIILSKYVRIPSISWIPKI
jgi:rod shape-determining protein MreD